MTAGLLLLYRRCGKSEIVNGQSILWKITNFIPLYTTRKKKRDTDTKRNLKNALDNGCVYLCEKFLKKL